MSQYYTVDIATPSSGGFDASGAASAAGTAVAGAVVGAAAVVTVVGVAAVVAGYAVTMTAKDGALALGGALVEEWKHQAAAQRAGLRGGSAQLRRIGLNFRDQASTAFGAALEARFGQVGRAGNLKLANGSDLALEYVAVDQQGAFLFGLSRTPEGTLEAYCSGDEGVRELHRASMDAVERLARQILGTQGYRRTVDMARGQVVYRRGRVAKAEQVVLRYDKSTGSLQIDARATSPDGRLLTGDECPDLAALMVFFQGARKQAHAPEPLDDDSGAARPNIASASHGFGQAQGR